MENKPWADPEILNIWHGTKAWQDYREAISRAALRVENKELPSRAAIAQEKARKAIARRVNHG